MSFLEKVGLKLGVVLVNHLVDGGLDDIFQLRSELVNQGIRVKVLVVRANGSSVNVVVDMIAVEAGQASLGRPCWGEP